MAKTISIDSLRKLKKNPDTVSRPMVEDHGCKSPDAFVILLDENKQSVTPSSEDTAEAVSQNRGNQQRH
jgi:hypothetical protein